MSVLKFKDPQTGKWKEIHTIAGPQGEPGPIGPEGPAGKDGSDGKDYVLTDADKAEIAGMIEVPEIDATDYYTKTEIDELLANLPSGGGDLPVAEGVGF